MSKQAARAIVKNCQFINKIQCISAVAVGAVPLQFKPGAASHTAGVGSLSASNPLDLLSDTEGESHADHPQGITTQCRAIAPRERGRGGWTQRYRRDHHQRR